MRNMKSVVRKPFSLLIISSLLFFIFILSSCSEPSLPKSINPPDGMGSFSLSLSPARTILPTAPVLDDFVNYELAFIAVTGGENETVNRTNATLASDPVLLYAGTYNLTVTAYRAGNLVAARGTAANIVINPGQNTSVSVMLHALIDEPNTEGTFKWNITLDTSPVTVTLATMKIFNTDGTQQGAAVNLASSGLSSGERTLASGMYTVSFDLEGTEEGEIKTVEWDELLYVYATLESNFTYTFTDEHFKKINWKVTLDNNFEGGGSVTQSVMHGSTISRPSPDPQRIKYDFIDWYTTNAAFTTPYDFASPITNDFTLFARWELTPVVTVTVGGVTTGYNDLTAAFTFIGNVAGDYIVTLKEDQTMSANRTVQTANQHITITGESGMRTISHSGFAAANHMFTISNASASLTLGNNITIKGRSETGAGTVVNMSAGLFTMQGNSRILEHTVNSISGAVYLTGGTFNMRENSEITGITASTATSAAVHLNAAAATFNMQGGQITANSNSLALTTTTGNGGVTVTNGIFNMSGGSVTSNTQSGEASDVYIATTTADRFTISGNATIGALKLNATSTTVGATVGAAGWTGVITTLNLRGDITAFATASGYWINSTRTIFGGITEAQVANIGLGEFISSSNVRQTIDNAYIIGTSSANLGWLTAKPMTTVPGTIVVLMYDSFGDGWDGNGSIRIDINGVQGVRTARLASGLTGTFSFDVEAGDIVELHWVSGSGFNENSFIVYHIESPPNPAFTASNNDLWNGQNALLLRLRGGQVAIGALGSFEVEGGNDARQPRIDTQPSNIYHYFYGAAPQPVLSVAAASLDGGTLSYQWYRNAENSATGGTAVGTNSSTYSPDVSTLGAVFYYCVVTNTNNAMPGNTTATRTTNVVRVRVSDTAAPVTVNADGFENLTLAFNSIGTTPGTYEILIDESQTFASRTLGTGMIISIASMTPAFPIEVQMTGTGSMFTVNSGASLTLTDVVLKGLTTNTTSLVRVDGGTLTMLTGSEITGNRSTDGYSTGTSAGGIGIISGTLNLNGGKIHSNTANDGGGITMNNGTINFTSGEISNNQASSSGGGIYMRGGTLTMSGGLIANNTSNSSIEGGGGVWMYTGGTITAIFNMTGGIIRGNRAINASGRGGGVLVWSGTFTKTGNSIIYGDNEGTNSNTAANAITPGHAVRVNSGRTRNTTAGEGVNLDSGTAVNWE